MKILYLSYFSSPKIFEKICEANLDPSVARQKFDLMLLENLLSNEILPSSDVEIVSYLPYNEKLGEVESTDEFLDKKINYVWAKRSGIFSILKAMKSVKKLVNDWLKRTEGEERIILTYAANPILLAPVIKYRKKVKFVTVCSEIPKYRNMTEGNKIVNAIKKKVFSYYNEKMSGYVFMSRHMNEACNEKGAPYIVVEGMTQIPPLSSIIKEDGERIFYAGGLHEENGISHLLDAIVSLNKYREKKVDLILCGQGNVQEKVKEYSNKHKFIKFLGSLPNDQIIELEKNATLLVNPRKPDFVLTKYSFPSKVFEYFASGTACALTKLEGIPEEFFDYCYKINVDSNEQLASDIGKILEIPSEERDKKAKEAYEFLAKEKSAKAQTEKIYNFLQSLIG